MFTYFTKEFNHYLNYGSVFSNTGGWGNGYVKVPKDSWLYGLDYYIVDVNVHGGLTYGKLQGEYWVYGFDTNHLYSRSDVWTKQRVEQETKHLAEQLWNLHLNPPKEEPRENELDSSIHCEVCAQTTLNCYC